jgi:hypothetical protein
MLTTDDVFPGQTVRLRESGHRATVLEVDRAFYAVRVMLSGGHEAWLLADDLETANEWTNWRIMS